MSDLSARLRLPFIAPAQAQKHVTHNEAILGLDALVQTTVQALEQDSPPATPAEGDIYGIGAAPSGDWAGQAGALAVWQNGGWVFVSPQEGFRVWDAATHRLMVLSAGSWEPVSSGTNEVEGVGVQTSWDTVNRLAVNAEATLLSNASGSHQLKVNKAASSDTATLLFQSAYTGHAEMGLAGDTSFAVKVSPDGSSWTEALKVDPVTAKLETPGVTLPSGDLQAALDEINHRISGRESVTITNGEITIGSARHVEITSETPGANDTLTQIHGGYDGQVVTFREAWGSGNITFANDTNGGNIQTANNTDLTITQSRDGITFSLEGTKWRMVALER